MKIIKNILGKVKNFYADLKITVTVEKGAVLRALADYGHKVFTLAAIIAGGLLIAYLASGIAIASIISYVIIGFAGLLVLVATWVLYKDYSVVRKLAADSYKRDIAKGIEKDDKKIEKKSKAKQNKLAAQRRVHEKYNK